MLVFLYRSKIIQFLGHRISGEGVAMDPDKISEIVLWHRPKNVDEVK